MGALDYRLKHVEKLEAISANVYKMQELLEVFSDSPDRSPEVLEDAKGCLYQIEQLSNRIDSRLSRIRDNECHVSVVGLEKAGKSTFINAWIGGPVLPSDTQRCTWAASTIRNGPGYEARVEFSTMEEFEDLLRELYSKIGLKYSKGSFPLSRQILEAHRTQGENECDDIEDLGKYWNSDIKRNLGKSDLRLSATSLEELRSKIFPYVSRVSEKESSRKLGMAYAVKHVDISVPLGEGDTDFCIDDLPGTNAPGNRAENMTYTVIKETANIIVFLKNCSSNASLDKNELAIWKIASNADSSMKIKDKLFVVLTKADISAEDNGRDGHISGEEEFVNKGVDKSKIFYCSAKAELYRRDKDRGELVDDSKEGEYQEAIQKIGQYMDIPQGTTGVPEFKRALVKFINGEFKKFEEDSLAILQHEYDDVCRRVSAFWNRFGRSCASGEDISRKVSNRFDTLWEPLGSMRGGLANKIKRTLADIISGKDTDSDIDKLSNRMKDAIRQSFEEFMPEITEEGFEEEFSAIASAERNKAEMRSRYCATIQKKLKEHIYGKFAHALSLDIGKAVQDIWEKARVANTEEAPKGLGALSTQDEIDYLKQHKSSLPNKLMYLVEGRIEGRLDRSIDRGTDRRAGSRHPSDSGNSGGDEGLGAFIRAIAYSCLERLFYTDMLKYREYAIRLARKAILQKFSNDLIDDDQRIRELSQGYNKAIDSPIRGLTPVKSAENYLGAYFPKEIVTLENSGLEGINDLVQVDNRQRNTNPAAYYNTASNPSEEDISATSVCQELEVRVGLFYSMLETMLDGKDFGFMGYYKSYLEEFRLAIVDALGTGGILREMAFKYKDRIWPDEELFRGNNVSQRIKELEGELKDVLGDNIEDEDIR